MHFAVSEILDFADWSLTHNCVANFDVLLEILSPETTIGELVTFSIDLDGKSSFAFFVHWRNWCVFLGNELAVDLAMEDEMTSRPKS
jgi:hypothetical protein